MYRSLSAILIFVFLSLTMTVSGEPSWARIYQSIRADNPSSIQRTADGGYIVAGSSGYFGLGASDFWVMKLNSSGNIEWQKRYGGNDFDESSSVQTASDGGYVVAGNTYSSASADDFHILKLDPMGNIQWQKNYGGKNFDIHRSIQTTSDGGYILAGSTESFGAGSSDLWILKLDALGYIQWQKAYGGNSYDVANRIQTTLDGGYIVAANTESFGAGSNDIWILKLDDLGNIQWQKTYGGAQNDYANSIETTTDGGYIVGGSKISFGNSDFWVLKLDSSGEIQWQKTYGGNGSDQAISVQMSSDEGYIVAGETDSFGSGEIDFWILKLDNQGELQWQKAYGGIDSDFLRSVQTSPDGGFITAGHTQSFGDNVNLSNAWILKADSNGIIGPVCSFTQDTSAIANNSEIIPSTSTASLTETAVIPSEPIVNTLSTSVVTIEHCSSSCRLCDDFEDNVIDQNWIYEKPSWIESDGFLTGISENGNAIAIAPAIAGCVSCTVEASVKTAGGAFNRVSLYVHRADKHNLTELLLKEGTDRVVLRQRINKRIVATAKARFQINPGTEYILKISFDGERYSVFINGRALFSMVAYETVPLGTVGLAVKNSEASFGHISVN